MPRNWSDADIAQMIELAGGVMVVREGLGRNNVPDLRPEDAPSAGRLKKFVGNSPGYAGYTQRRLIWGSDRDANERLGGRWSYYHVGRIQDLEKSISLETVVT